MRMMRAVVRERRTTSKSELGENLASSSSSATETARDKKENDAARVQKATVGREEEEDRILNATIATCPLSREDLGTGTWGLLHTIAAHFPEKPSTVEQVQARRFFDALGDLLNGHVVCQRTKPNTIGEFFYLITGCRYCKLGFTDTARTDQRD